jgi:hypothetical protein
MLEWQAYREGWTRFPWMFAVSATCFAFNAALVLGHRLAAV